MLTDRTGKVSLLLLIGMTVLPALAAVVLQWGWDFQGLYGQDAHDYFLKALKWRQWWEGGSPPRPIHYPQGYPFIGALVSFINGDVLFALRALSLLSLPLIAWLLCRVLVLHGGDGSVVTVFALIAIAASPFLLRGSMMVMSDMPCLLLCLIAFTLAVNDRQGPMQVFLAVLAVGAAFSVRYAAAPLMAPLVAWLAVGIVRERHWRKLVAMAVALLIIVVVGSMGRAALGDFEHHPWLLDWSPLNFLRRSFSTLDGEAHYLLPNIVHACVPLVHPGYLLVGAPLLFFFRWNDLRQVHVRVAALMLLGYILFLAGVPFQNDRFLLLAAPFVAILLFPAFERARAWLLARKIPFKPVVAGLIAIQLGLFAYGMRVFVRLAVMERELADLVRARPEHTLYQFSLGPALATHGVQQRIIDLWGSRIEDFEPGSLLLFNPEAFAAQWKGKRPMLNWERAMAQGMDPIVARDDGWVLYRVR